MTIQGKYMTTQASLEQFQNMIDDIGHTGGMVGHQPGIERDIMRRERSIDPTNATTMQQMEIEKDAQNRYLAVAFMLGSDKARFGRLLENLENDYRQGQNNYPTSITAAYNLVTNWKQDPRSLISTSGPVNDGVSFTNVDSEHGEQDIALTNNGHTKSGRNKLSHITCHRCGKQGHFAEKCEEKRQEPH